MMKKILLMMPILAGLLFVFSCKEELQKDDAKLVIRLTDAPIDFDEVNVEILDIKIHLSSDTTDNGEWISFDQVNQGVYNLLDFQNGADTLLASIETSERTVSQIRLMLGDNNTVKIGDDVFELDTPSAAKSGLKINLAAALKVNSVEEIWLDFDAGLSVKQSGNGKYKLSPVIKVLKEKPEKTEEEEEEESDEGGEG